ncbi:MAG: PEP-CTERM sorting domain-containing protein [Verrucomicrobiota bacterium]
MKKLLAATVFAAFGGVASIQVSAAVLPNTTANGVVYLTYDRAAWATVAPYADYTDIHSIPTGASGPSADATGQRWMYPDRFEGTSWVGAAYPSDYLTGPTAPLVQPVGGFALPVNTYGLNSFAADHQITSYNSTSDPNGYIGLGGSFRATSDFNEPGASVWWEHLALMQDATDNIWKLYATSGPGQGSLFELRNVTTETVDGNLHLSGDYVFGNTDWLQFFQDYNGHLNPDTVLGHIELVPAAVPEPTSLGLLGVAGLAFLARRHRACKKLAMACALLPVIGASQSHAEIGTYNITETFFEPDTQPRNSIFNGSFTYDTASKTISGLNGLLSESMTDTDGSPIDANHMVWIPLNNQLVSWYDSSLGGTFAAVFKNTNTKTFYNPGGVGPHAVAADGGDFWSPEVGVAGGGVYFGFPTKANNPGNAYALIFVPDSPLDALTQTQIDKLAYADCVPTAPGGMLKGGGMMGAVGMTGTSVAGYGAVGTMNGYPVSQVITAVPEPASLGLLSISGLGLLAMWRSAKRTANQMTARVGSPESNPRLYQ